MDLFAVTSQAILERIARHCPQAMTTYLHCFNRVDDLGQVEFSREMIETEMSESYTAFRNHLKKLAREDLLEWRPAGDGFKVTLADTINE